ncbi:MAG: CPBP family intramembrane metalloprotease [Anaerolineales bacterium]|nr:CPBP family intramembrane metalloprotease [Anaerolineales bacterium]
MRWLRRASPVWVFLILVFVLSWPFLIYGFGWCGSRDAILARYLLACTGMLMVALSAFITRAFVEGKGFHDVGWNLGRINWYLAALILFVLLWLGPPSAASLFGKSSWNQNLSKDEVVVIILSLGGFSLLAGFGEEFGWRGYLIPRLLTDRKRTREVLVLIGLIWGVWHCSVDIGPLFRAVVEGEIGWASWIAPTLLQCLQSIAVSIALSFIFGAVWLKGGSIFLSSFFHGYYIGVRDSAALIFSYPVIFQLVTLVVILIAWFIAYRWLQEYERWEDV